MIIITSKDTHRKQQAEHGEGSPGANVRSQGKVNITKSVHEANARDITRDITRTYIVKQ